MRYINNLLNLLIFLRFCISLNSFMQDYETINYKVTINYCIKHSKKYGMVNEKNLKDGLNMISKRTCIEFVRKPSCEEKKKTCIKKCSSKRPKKCGKKSGKKPKRKCIEICTVVPIKQSSPHVRFVYDKHTDESNFFYFNGTVGLMRTIIYDLKINENCNENPGCFAKKVLMWMGLIPTVRRRDRAEFIWVEPDRIKSEYKKLYEKLKDVPLLIGYDWASIAHFSVHYGAVGTQPIYWTEQISVRDQEITGQEIRPAFSDLKWVYLAYCMKDNVYTVKCENGGYLKWNKTDECECPTGFTGKKCEWPEQSDHGCPKSFEIVSNTSYTTLLFKGKKNCTVVLEAIKNYKIYILMEQLICKRILPCFEGTCLQLKFQADKALTGYCICGNDDGRWFTTHNNKAVIKYSGLDDSHFARVKYYLGPYYY